MFRFFLFCLMCIAAHQPVSSKDKNRFALLIGNKDYNVEVGTLVNPINDITLIGQALESLDFQVKRVSNANLGEMQIALNQHTRRLRDAGQEAIGFFYYSGHGAMDAETKINYIIPVDVPSTSSRELWDRSYKVSDITRLLSEQAKLAHHFAVFDACRNELKLRSKGTKSLYAPKGWEPVQSLPSMLIAYSTAPGKLASDLGQGAGPYASALAVELKRPDVEAITLFRRTALSVEKKIGQQPWMSSGPIPSIYFSRSSSVKKDLSKDLLSQKKKRYPKKIRNIACPMP